MVSGAAEFEEQLMVENLEVTTVQAVWQQQVA